MAVSYYPMLSIQFIVVVFIIFIAPSPSIHLALQRSLANPVNPVNRPQVWHSHFHHLETLCRDARNWSKIHKMAIDGLKNWNWRELWNWKPHEDDERHMDMASTGGMWWFRYGTSLHFEWGIELSYVLDLLRAANPRVFSAPFYVVFQWMKIAREGVIDWMGWVVKMITFLLLGAPFQTWWWEYWVVCRVFFSYACCDWVWKTWVTWIVLFPAVPRE